MSTAFTRTLTALDADRFIRPSIALILTGLLLCVWAVWACFSQVTLRAMSESARVEVDRAAYPVQTPVSGRVVQTFLSVGREVQAGEPLVELDSSPERLQWQEERIRAEAIGPALAALRAQVDAELQTGAREQEATRTAVEQAHANARSVEAPARYATAEAGRLTALRAQGLIAERDYQRALADAGQARAAMERERLAAERLTREQSTKESERDARIRGLQANISRLEGQAATAKAAIERLENEITRRTIRAPAAGRLAEAAVLRAGAVLHEGDKLAVIIPEGRLRVVAHFDPAAALGRVAEGQRAELRLQGFPWAQWGTVPAVIERVAGEIREGLVRVELKIDGSRPSRIPLQHGMPGSVEVSVEKIAPAALVLRLAGRWLGSPRHPFQLRAATARERL